MVFQPDVGAKTFAATAATTAVVCKSAAMGALVDIEATLTETGTESTYYFDLSFVTSGNPFAAQLGSGLSDGDTYPAILSTPGAGAEVKLIESKAGALSHIRVATP